MVTPPNRLYFTWRYVDDSAEAHTHRQKHLLLPKKEQKGPLWETRLEAYIRRNTRYYGLVEICRSDLGTWFVHDLIPGGNICHWTDGQYRTLREAKIEALRLSQLIVNDFSNLTLYVPGLP